jgi:regulator of ribosome biosynthesis
MDTEMETEQIYQVDVGNLLAFNPNHRFPSAPSSRGELVKEILTEGTKLVQEIANKLFNFPSTETNDGPIVQLPPPTTKLPREKHIPRPKPPTKWEEFALKKGKSCLRNCFKDWKLYFVQILMGRRPLCSIV